MAVASGKQTDNVYFEDDEEEEEYDDEEVEDDEDDEDDESCSDLSSTTSTSTNNQRVDGGRVCDCCYCEVFGHGLPAVAPTSRNFNEMRERLRVRLSQRKAERGKCENNRSKTNGTIGSDTRRNDGFRKPDDRALEELVQFIEGHDENKEANNKTNNKNKRKKERQKKKKELVKQKDKSNQPLTTPANSNRRETTTTTATMSRTNSTTPQSSLCPPPPSTGSPIPSVTTPANNLTSTPTRLKASKNEPTSKLSSSSSPLIRNTTSSSTISSSLLSSSSTTTTTTSSTSSSTATKTLTSLTSTSSSTQLASSTIFTNDLSDHSVNNIPAAALSSSPKAVGGDIGDVKKSSHHLSSNGNNNNNNNNNNSNSSKKLSMDLSLTSSINQKLKATHSSDKNNCLNLSTHRRSSTVSNDQLIDESVSSPKSINSPQKPDNKVDKQDKRNKSDRGKSSRKKIEDISFVDEVFKPKDIDLENEELDETEKEVEAFKRFCYNSVPLARKDKVNIDLSNILITRRPIDQFDTSSDSSNCYQSEKK